MLDHIIAYKGEELRERQRRRPLAEVVAACDLRQPVRDFASAIRRTDGLKLLAEVKRASPSRGEIAPAVSPGEVAVLYEQAGASAISVLTDERFFAGSDSHVAEVKKAVSVPVLRKDFTLSDYHVYEARAIGSDAILLMTQVLEPQQLRDLLALAQDLGLHCLVEGHSPEEVETAVESGAHAIGINNRDLRTLKVDLGTTADRLSLIPPDRIVVSQSGFLTREDVLKVEGLRVDAIQVGTSLMASGEIPSAVAALLGR